MENQEYPTGKPAVVTCGLPYANGDLHIGHLRTYVGGDVFARALETLGQETAFVSGSDMHGTPVAVNAEKEGVDPESFALAWHEQYEETFPKFGVEFDNYGHTHDETNTELTLAFVEAMEREGYVYEKEIKVAWDPEADQALPDRYVEGTCPYCGELARGDECDEGCGRHLEPGEIEDPVSTITGNPAEYRDRTHKFFRVSELSEYLSGFLDRLEGTSNARNQPREWIEDGLQDWCITRDLDWGIDYPGAPASDEDAEARETASRAEDDLVLYVWVDAPIEYVASTKQYSERVGADEYDWERAWKADGVSASSAERSSADHSSGRSPREDDASGGSPDERSESGGEIVHVIGRDIIQHHTIFWPAMLNVVGYDEPRAVMASGFMTLNGQGFSTSRNRAVWADEYLEEGFHPDLLRYYLATNGGFQQDVDFSWEKFADRVNGELVGTLGNFLYRSLLFADRNWGGTPDAEVSGEVRERIEQATDEFRAAVNDYSVRAVGETAVELARFGNEYIQRNEPWKLVDEDEAAAAVVIRDCVQLAKAIAVLSEPVLPDKAERLWRQLGEDGSVHDAELSAATEAPPAEFAESPEEPFEGIEDERVEALNGKLAERVEAATEAEPGDTETHEGEADEPPGVSFEPIADERVSFEEFQELDLRVGHIETVDPIEGADDLVRLEVDIGVERRQVVAGIKQLHDLDELPGTKVVVVANLEKSELFGVESDGMVLAAGEQADLLTTRGDAEPGEKVR